MPLEYKSVPFEVKGADRNDEDTGWEIAGLASTFWGEPDAYNDVVAPGAFSRSIAERATKFLFEHQIPIGKQLEIRETDQGLYGRWSIVDTTAGTDAYKLAKAGVLDSLSIGYMPLEWTIRDDGVRVLEAVELYEVSAVSLPANVHAVITDVKADVTGQSRPFDRHSEDVRVAVSEWLSRVRSGSDLRQQDGRSLSAARREVLATVSGSLRSTADDVDALVTASEPVPLERLVLDHEQRRRRLAKLGIVLEAP